MNTIGIKPAAQRPRPHCLVNYCAAWKRPCGCGYISANTPCAHPVHRARQDELPTIKTQVDGGEQLRFEEEL